MVEILLVYHTYHILYLILPFPPQVFSVADDLLTIGDSPDAGDPPPAPRTPSSSPGRPPPNPGPPLPDPRHPPPRPPLPAPRPQPPRCPLPQVPLPRPPPNPPLTDDGEDLGHRIVVAMGVRSGGRKLSFNILSQTFSDDGDGEALFRRSNSDPIRNHTHNHHQSDENHKLSRKKRRRRKKTTPGTIDSSIAEDPIAENGVELGSVTDGPGITEVSGESYCSNGLELNCQGYGVATVVCEVNGGGSVSTVTTVVAESPGFQNVRGDMFNSGKLRQRSVNGGSIGGDVGVVEDAASRVGGEEKVESGAEVNSAGKQRNEPNGNVVTRLETAESLDWKRLMAEDPNYMFSSEKSPWKYFMDDMLSGNSLRNTTTAGNEKERERVYDTIFRLPWRCELLINVGFFVCFDSFLSLLTIVPARILMTFWRLLKTRQFKRPSAAELSDFGCFVIMFCGVTLLERTDISLIYHMIRGQGTIKLYVVYNVLEDSITEDLAGASLVGGRGGVWNALLVYVCEMAIDIIKHSFIAKFNGMKPIAYSEFLEDLCKQTLKIQPDDSKNILSFVPLAPACVVIRVMTPVYNARLPTHPLPWRLFWIILHFFMTYVMLASLKVLIGMGLQKHAACHFFCRKIHRWRGKIKHSGIVSDYQGPEA
ncbi:hypothetical protein TIFTF001_007613 [Ficus carica]|uniref:Uncharacterized protein n=1 Tax=Ficus carica TaxID=3494 RepID=A0AA87ZLL4_FICCA|nr:hypothetical protein TIFTF001_007613 [Ficus carica]